MKDFLFVNTRERSALMGLPYVHQVTYLMGIRPYMDRKTQLVGIKRRISYQSLSEVLYIEPHQGMTQSGSPSKQQIRRVIKGLERAGLILNQSTLTALILKCLLADSHSSVENKPDTNPTSYPDRQERHDNPVNQGISSSRFKNPDSSKSLNPDIPHNSKGDYVCVLREKFESFWALYPVKFGRLKAWEAFQELNPDNSLFERILCGLKQQIEASALLKNNGHWVPKWKYPTNWLAQQCWDDEINLDVIKGKEHATSQTDTAKRKSVDLLWEACKDSLQDESL